jgi:hypothetical protein
VQKVSRVRRSETNAYKQTLKPFSVIPENVGSDLNHVLNIAVFLQRMSDFEEMSAAYAEAAGETVLHGYYVLDIKCLLLKGARLVAQKSVILPSPVRVRNGLHFCYMSNQLIS